MIDVEMQLMKQSAEVNQKEKVKLHLRKKAENSLKVDYSATEKQYESFLLQQNHTLTEIMNQ